ncbi:MAG: hypothetical protein RLZ93_1230, partial [Bacteroidota bacterium]
SKLDTHEAKAHVPDLPKRKCRFGLHGEEVLAINERKPHNPKGLT